MHTIASQYANGRWALRNPRKYNGLLVTAISAKIRAGRRNMVTEDRPCSHFMALRISGLLQSRLPNSLRGMPVIHKTTNAITEEKKKPAPNSPKKIPSCDHGDLMRK